MGLAILLVSHDLALIDDVCDRVVSCMREPASRTDGVRAVARPRHPYTAALHRSRIELAVPGSDLVTIAAGRLLSVPGQQAVASRTGATLPQPIAPMATIRL